MRCVPVEVVFDGGNVHNQPFLGDGYKLFPDAAGRELTGIEFNTGVSDIEEIKIVNIGPDDVTLKHEGANSLEENRFHLLGGLDKVLTPGQPYWLVYIESGPFGSRWYGEATS
jgi:hypothetical protein